MLPLNFFITAFCEVQQEDLDVFLATGKDLVVNGLLKEQGIEDIIEPNTFNTGYQDTEQGIKQT